MPPTLGPVRFMSQRSPFMGAEVPSSMLTTLVTLDGKPAPDINVEFMFQDGSMISGKTDAAGKFERSYTQDQMGQGMVRIEAPSGIDVGEEGVKGVNLDGSPAIVMFDLVSPEGAEMPPSPASPAVPVDMKSVGVAALTVGVMTAIGLSI